MTKPAVPSLIDEMVDDLIREHLLPSDKPSNINRDTRIEDLPTPISSTLHIHHWKHEVRRDLPPA